MGQAKKRGSLEDRIAQSKARKQAPEPGLYVSTKGAKGMRFIVEEVTMEEDDFFLVELIDEASADDMGAMGDELDPEQWFALVEQFGLVKAPN